MGEIVEKTVYIYEGKTYTKKEDAEEAKNKNTKRIVEYLKKFKYRPDKYGIWVIKDEGPIDFGASGGPSVLGYVEGSYEDAVKFAFTLPRFYGYGPGYIDFLDIKVLGSTQLKGLQPMTTAPKSGDRILIEHHPKYFKNGEWKAIKETIITEAYWDTSYQGSESNGKWSIWRGNVKTITTESIGIPIGWYPRPS